MLVAVECRPVPATEPRRRLGEYALWWTHTGLPLQHLATTRAIVRARLLPAVLLLVQLLVRLLQDASPNRDVLVAVFVREVVDALTPRIGSDRLDQSSAENYWRASDTVRYIFREIGGFSQIMTPAVNRERQQLVDHVRKKQAIVFNCDNVRVKRHQIVT